ncbi:hypothetical protein CU098_008873 [Rhizopus stolonifer]|uniref:Uncharacterized protein n=1 Tax=Rhizopus stolonifer TaxID=4846 RepID=A0A367J8C2_RHIST|nr:hypothetical protein CU098_008873 [Rhizopus stolonifer]
MLVNSVSVKSVERSEGSRLTLNAELKEEVLSESILVFKAEAASEEEVPIDNEASETEGQENRHEGQINFGE